MVMQDYLQADVVVKVNSIIMDAKDFKVLKSLGTMKVNTSVSDDNIVFNVMRQICSEAQRMELSKVYILYELQIQLKIFILGFELCLDRNDAG